MSRRLLLLLLLGWVVATPARAFPPAPHHVIYGMVRDQFGRPLNPGEGTIILSGATGEIVRAPSDPDIALGANYSLSIPMDSGTNAQLYEITRHAAVAAVHDQSRHQWRELRTHPDRRQEPRHG